MPKQRVYFVEEDVKEALVKELDRSGYSVVTGPVILNECNGLGEHPSGAIAYADVEKKPRRQRSMVDV